MRINTNVSSLNAQESAVNTSKSLSNSLEKLSSGLRINKASDDASGLAIADKLRTQATSIGQGISNGNSAITLLQIADKSMGEQSNILDTIKSKLVQANTDTTSDAGRESIRKDIAKLLTQLDNIAAQTNYNGKSLLADVKNGKLSGKEASALNFQIGANNSDIISTSSINATSSSLGGGSDTKVSEIKAEQSATLKNLDGGTVTLNAATGTMLDLNISGNLGKVTAATGNDLTIVVDPSDTALIAKLKNIDTNSANFTKSATYDNIFTISTGAAVDFSSVEFTNVQLLGTANNLGFKAEGDSFKVTNNNLSKNVSLSQTQNVGEGESTTISSTNTHNNLSLSSAGTGLNITITGNLGSFSVATGAASGVTIEATNNTDIAALQKLIDDGNSTITRSGDKFTFSSATTYDLSNITLSDAKMTASGATASANIFTSTSSSDISIKNNDTNAITLSNIDVKSGNNLSTLKNLSENGLSQAVASSFQTVVDDAITQLNGYRGDIGSTQNQVESAVRNLSTQQTNIKAAESVIRDVDYAAESANFNKQNIISQAGSYAISQANSVQQNVLKLLQ